MINTILNVDDICQDCPYFSTETDHLTNYDNIHTIYMNTHLGHIQNACKRIIEEQLKVGEKKRMIYKNGYEMVDKMFEEIGKSKNHEISLESSFKFIDFYGLIDGCTLPANEGKRQFVGRCVLERLNKAFLDGEICIKAGVKNE